MGGQNLLHPEKQIEIEKVTSSEREKGPLFEREQFLQLYKSKMPFRVKNYFESINISVYTLRDKRPA